MPRLNIEEEAFARIGEPLTKEEIDLKASEIDYTNLELDTEEETKKPKLKNSSVEKMRKMFDPEVDVVRKRTDPKRFYVFNPSLTPEEAEKRRKNTFKACAASNYFELRVGDTV
jgi:hypothetical protein